MALFGNKKTAKAEPVSKEKTADVSVKKTGQGSSLDKDYSRVLRQPRVTEKATMVTENNAYVFEVDPRATKEDIKHAIIEFYKVTPQKINTTQIPSKKVQSRRRGVFGRKSGGKKAYVYFKKGDTIDIV